MCWKCGTKLAPHSPVSRSEVCPVCGKSVRSCKNCRFYSESAHYECSETVDECVTDKEDANFCGYFELSQKESAASSDKASEARKKIDSLFSI